MPPSAGPPPRDGVRSTPLRGGGGLCLPGALPRYNVDAVLRGQRPLLLRRYRRRRLAWAGLSPPPAGPRPPAPRGVPEGHSRAVLRVGRSRRPLQGGVRGERYGSWVGGHEAVARLGAPLRRRGRGAPVEGPHSVNRLQDALWEGPRLFELLLRRHELPLELHDGPLGLVLPLLQGLQLLLCGV